MATNSSILGRRRFPTQIRIMGGRATRARRWILAAVVVSSGLSFFQTPAHAIPMVYTAVYARSVGSSETVSTEALFDSISITGTGTEYAPLDSFAMVFSLRGYLQAADIVSSVEPWPDGTLLARYVDGVFDTLWSQDNGGSNRITVSPPANWLGEGISLGKNELIDFPCCSGFTKFELITSSGPTPVPEPNTALLISLGLVGLAARHRHLR